MSDTMSIEKRLKDKGYKLTNQRKAIIEVLSENKDHFLTAEEIYLKSREKCPDTNFSTIYRNLNLLETAGIIHNTKINDGAFVYELTADSNHHHYIICKGCGKAEALSFCPFDDICSKLKSDDFTLTDHKFELYGYCKDCDKKKQHDD